MLFNKKSFIELLVKNEFNTTIIILSLNILFIFFVKFFTNKSIKKAKKHL
jgi:hypothetical protein